MTGKAHPPITRSTPLDALPAMLRVGEVAAWCDVGRSTIYEQIKRGQLASVKFGKNLRVPRSELTRISAGTKLEPTK
jgi:excisionase family DNA binding protein